MCVHMITNNKYIAKYNRLKYILCIPQQLLSLELIHVHEEAQPVGLAAQEKNVYITWTQYMQALHIHCNPLVKWVQTVLKKGLSFLYWLIKWLIFIL